MGFVTIIKEIKKTQKRIRKNLWLKVVYYFG